MDKLKFTIISGNLGKAPHLHIDEDKVVKAAYFSVAVSSAWKDRETGQLKERTTWVEVSVYNRALLEGVMKILGPGSRVYIEGFIQSREVIKDDVKSQKNVFIAREILCLDKRNKNDASSSDSYDTSASEARAPQRYDIATADGDNDIPF